MNVGHILRSLLGALAVYVAMASCGAPSGKGDPPMQWGIVGAVVDPTSFVGATLAHD